MIEISPELNEYRLQGVINFLARGTTNAYAEVYAGAQPAYGGTPNGPLLVTVPLVEPLGTLAGGVLNISPTPEAMIANTGEAVWARVRDGDGVLGWDCDVSGLLGTGALKMSSTTLYAGGYTRIASGTIG